ncbi:hypothetical protein RISK_003411 [Rhodopirellula islandica]|uniref:Uncharacterized protein n=1 Tax=Rhodopirellula islandica TaxID=595434 RepID=A0A0J1BCM3_RHOIS|nr:hypothetical protein RISK_003411 [Rhodopirellula islandica]
MRSPAFRNPPHPVYPSSTEGRKSETSPSQETHGNQPHPNKGGRAVFWCCILAGFHSAHLS